LEEPGVLATPFVHYGSELRLVAAASRRLVEKLVALDDSGNPRGESVLSSLRGLKRLPIETESGPAKSPRWDLPPALPIENLASELIAIRSLLVSLAGPAIDLRVDTEGGTLPVQITAEDLTRILVNLVKNSVEAMSSGGQIAIKLHEFHAGVGCPSWLVLTLEDNGPGIDENSLDKVFEAGYTMRPSQSSVTNGWPTAHQGLGLSITRSIIEAAGGTISVSRPIQGGANFEIELPVRQR